MSHQIRSTVEDAALVMRRRAQITTVAAELFAHRGYHPTTIRDIALAADVSVGLIYQYVGDKEDLLYLAITEIVDIYFREIPQAISSSDSPLDGFIAAVRVFCRIIDERRDAALLAYREITSLREERIQEIKQLELATNQLIKNCVCECITSGVFRDDIDPDLMTYLTVVFAHGWTINAWRLGGALTVDEYVGRGLELLLNPVLAKSRKIRSLSPSATRRQPTSQPGTARPATKSRIVPRTEASNKKGTSNS